MDSHARKIISKLTSEAPNSVELISTELDALMRQLQLNAIPTMSDRNAKAPQKSTPKPAKAVRPVAAGASNNVSTVGASNDPPRSSRSLNTGKTSKSKKNVNVPQGQQSARKQPAIAAPQSNQLPVAKAEVLNHTSTRVPPILLRDKTFWPKLLPMFKEKQLEFSKAKNLSEAITIQPCTVADHRGISRLFKAKQIPFHTYPLPSEKPLYLVLRDVPVSFSDEAVKKDLLDQGIPVISVRRMSYANGKRLAPLVCVQVKRAGKKLSKVHRVLQVEVQVERQRKKKDVRQCHRCQQFGHAQRYCHARPRCVKCAEEHRSVNCTKDRNLPAVCANCAGPHPANYRGCLAFYKHLYAQLVQARLVQAGVPAAS